MNTKVKIYAGLLVLLFAAIIFLDSNQPKPVDWRPSYALHEKSPLGLLLLNNEIEKLLDANVTRFSNTPYEFLTSMYDDSPEEMAYIVGGTLMSISEVNTLDAESINEMFYFANHGNRIFLSLKSFPKAILDSLKVETGNDFTMEDSTLVRLANPQFASSDYYIAEDASTTYFSKIDTAVTTVLGFQGEKNQVNFIKIPYRSGEFILHTQPAAFSNVHLLKHNRYQYSEKVLAYAKADNMYWYSKSAEDAPSNSPLRYILSQSALKWAWYIFLIGMLLFIVFNAKRKQRVVPIIKPLENTTVEFAKTIGNLYFQEGDHNTIIDKKIIYFLERIRSEYLIDTTKLDDDFIRKLHQKSGKDSKEIERVVHLINMHRNSYHHGVEGDLIQINNAIEQILH